MPESPTTFDPTVTAPAAPVVPTTPAPDTGADPDYKAEAEKAKADVEKWKAMSRKHEDQAKTNADAVKAAKTLEERLAELEKRNVDTEARATRVEIASAKGLPTSLARYLQGNTPDELEASADELLKELGKNKAAAPAPDKGKAKPTENLKPGAVPGAEPPLDYEAIAARVAKAPAFGRR